MALGIIANFCVKQNKGFTQCLYKLEFFTPVDFKLKNFMQKDLKKKRKHGLSLLGSSGDQVKTGSFQFCSRYIKVQASALNTFANLNINVTNEVYPRCVYCCFD